MSAEFWLIASEEPLGNVDEEVVGVVMVGAGVPDEFRDVRRRFTGEFHYRDGKAGLI